MKIFPILFVCILAINAFGQATTPDTALTKYLEFLAKKDFANPKNYILDLFKEKDIVIFSERQHPEITQYELLLRIIKDERFQGHVFTEIGTTQVAPAIHAFLKKEGLSEEAKEKALLEIERNLVYRIAWEAYNYYDLLSSIYELNQGRKLEDKVMVYPLDVHFDWRTIKNTEQYQLFENLQNRNLIDRDLTIGVNFVETYQKAKKESPARNKALVILNTYHAYIRIPSYLPLPTEPFIYSAAEYIYKTYPHTTTNVLINSLIFAPQRSLVANGKWDAAFQYSGNKPIGFDLKNTPFGTDQFDLYHFGNAFESVNFEFMFDGFVFYQPIEEFNLALGIPNLYSGPYQDVFYQRMAIIKGQTEAEVRASKAISETLESLNTLKYQKMRNLGPLKAQRDQWLKN